MGAFCLICMNFVWRTVSIGLVSGMTCALLALLTLLNTSLVDTVIEEVSQGQWRGLSIISIECEY